MPTETVLSALFTVAIVAWILYRQLSTRRVKSDLFKVPMIFGVIGVFQTIGFFANSPAPVPVAQWVGLGLSLLVGGVLAVPRADSMRLWQAADGTWMRRGTIVTLLWWAASLGLHVVAGRVLPAVLGGGGEAFSGATLFLYLAVILGVQGLRLERRIETLVPGSRGRAARRDLAGAR